MMRKRCVMLKMIYAFPPLRRCPAIHADTDYALLRQPPCAIRPVAPVRSRLPPPPRCRAMSAFARLPPLVVASYTPPRHFAAATSDIVAMLLILQNAMR